MLVISHCSHFALFEHIQCMLKTFTQIPQRRRARLRWYVGLVRPVPLTIYSGRCCRSSIHLTKWFQTGQPRLWGYVLSLTVAHSRFPSLLSFLPSQLTTHLRDFFVVLLLTFPHSRGSVDQYYSIISPGGKRSPENFFSLCSVLPVAPSHYERAPSERFCICVEQDEGTPLVSQILIGLFLLLTCTSRCVPQSTYFSLKHTC